MNVLAAMSEPTTYPHQVDRIRHLETHISHVFLTGEFAYKLKKPLQNPFLDYRTLEARKRYCAQELELNRRFSPELYVGVVAIAKDANGWNLEGRGEIVEYAVKMREFSQDELLLSQLRSGKLTEEQVRSLGAELAAIHQAAPRLPDLSAAYGSPSVVAEESRDNVRALRQLAPESQRGLVEELAAEIEQQLQKLEPVFAERRARGFIRECHGDLHLGNLIWRAGRVQLFDGIEFNESFRWIDLMSDLGFVLMDLEEHRQPGLANLLLNVYLEASGDFGGLQVLNFYKVYRALVRAKVAALRANQQVSQSRAHSWEEVVEYLEYAAAAFVVRHPRLILTHGVSGSGKTFQTEPLLKLPGLIRIRSDVERKRMEGLRGVERAGFEPGAGMYTAARKNLVYQQLCAMARRGIESGWTILIDATFLQAENRQPFQQLAAELDVPLQILHFEAAEEILKARLRERAARGRDASDADCNVLELQLRSYQPLAAEELACCTSVDRLQKELTPAERSPSFRASLN